ncbi:hypothetical protein RI543_004853 [Arxiozyma heterogenica]|uniref:Uncharacterized protein n=1 Tax=Arxiozyma heterogenica TaxID=278026 RepID=A0AAN7WG85_9SACH|nr:hypothetical protein RI543_004853 [Kazachstania heterogenica]
MKKKLPDPLTKFISRRVFAKLKVILQHELTPKELLPITVLWNSDLPRSYVIQSFYYAASNVVAHVWLINTLIGSRFIQDLM